MGRKLPDYNPEADGPYETSKRRREIFKRIYRKRQHWRALQEDHGMEPFITTPDGEDVFYGDLMVGEKTLPPQQWAAFDRICLREYTEDATREEILPNSRWSTPVQQYSEDGLKKMIAAYDAKQAGVWDPAEAVKKKRRVRKADPEVGTTPETPEVPEETPLKFSRIERLDWSVCSDANQRFADYIKETTGLKVTGQMVKAVAFLRKPWSHSEEERAVRVAEAERKAEEEAKFANETPEQREKRFKAIRREKSAKAAQKRALDLQDEVRQLRTEAGLDPETGEPVVAA